jgi:hypothetical protein
VCLLSGIHGLPVRCSLISRACRGSAEEGRNDTSAQHEEEMCRMSKGTGSKRTTKIALLIIVVVAAAGVAVWLSSPSNTGKVSAKIEIPANGVQVSVGGATANITVDNIGSVPTTINTIYVNGAAYSSCCGGGESPLPSTFYPTSCSGGICNTANWTQEIAPGQSLTFTVLFSPPLQRGNVTFKVVGTSGAEATAQITY